MGNTGRCISTMLGEHFPFLKTLSGHPAVHVGHGGSIPFSEQTAVLQKL